MLAMFCKHERAEISRRTSCAEKLLSITINVFIEVPLFMEFRPPAGGLRHPDPPMAPPPPTPTPPPRPPARPPGPPIKKVFNIMRRYWIVRSTISRIGLSMDRTIQYFQDRTEYGSYDPIFPGYENLEESVFQYFQNMRN